MTTFRLRRAAAVTRRVGQMEWTTPGTYQFVVPMSVFSISAVVVGGGGSGGGSNYSSGGHGADGGDLRYVVSLPVTPGEVLTIIVGDIGPVPGQYDTSATNGTPSIIRRGATSLLSGGRRGIGSSFIGTSGGITIGGGNGGAGTGGWDTSPNSGSGGAGGGAGGYSGNGGSNNIATPAGGGGGSGYRSNIGARIGGQGGGVGIYGEGASGVVGNTTTRDGTAGSGGIGRLFGGGAGGEAFPAGGVGTSGNPGGGGAVRIIWGAGRAYPSTRTANEFP